MCISENLTTIGEQCKVISNSIEALQALKKIIDKTDEKEIKGLQYLLEPQIGKIHKANNSISLAYENINNLLGV